MAMSDMIAIVSPETRIGIRSSSEKDVDKEAMDKATSEP